MSDQDIWGDAGVSHTDWVGTAALDQRITARPDGNSGIESLVGLDRDEWMVVGIEIQASEHYRGLRVLAVSKDLIPPGGDVLPKIAAENGGAIPVTEFHVHDFDPFEALQAIIHEFELRLRRYRAIDLPIRVVAVGDLPAQQ